MKIDLEQFNRYLGDGVYASYDGYQIWLAANHHENKVVALEPSVVRAFVRYFEWLHAELIQLNKEVDKGNGNPE